MECEYDPKPEEFATVEDAGLEGYDIRSKNERIHLSFVILTQACKQAWGLLADLAGSEVRKREFLNLKFLDWLKGVDLNFILEPLVGGFLWNL